MRDKFVIFNNVVFYIGVFFLFLGTFDLLGFGQIFVSIAFALIFINSIFYLENISIRDVLLVLFFCFSYFLIYTIVFDFSKYVFGYFMILPVFAYCIGHNYSNFSSRLKMVLFSFMFGYLFKGLEILATSIAYQGFRFSEFLTTIEYINGKFNILYISRNGLSVYFMPIISYCLVFLTNKSNYKKSNIIQMIMLYFLFLIGILSSFIVGNRAFIVCIFLMILIRCIGFLISKNDIKLNLIFGSLFVILCIIYILIRSKVIVLPDFLMNIEAIRRLVEGGSTSERLSLYVSFFENAWKYPFGGLYFVNGRYVHNFYFDLYNFTGIIPFAIFTYFILKFIMLSFIKKKVNFGKNETENFTKWIFIGFVVLGLFEPLFQTEGILLSIFFMIFGFASGIEDYHLIQNKLHFKNSFARVKI